MQLLFFKYFFYYKNIINIETAPYRYPPHPSPPQLDDDHSYGNQGEGYHDNDSYPVADAYIDSVDTEKEVMLIQSKN